MWVSRSDPLGDLNGRGECLLGLLSGEYSRRMGIWGGICTAEVEDKQAEGEEEETGVGCGRKHLWVMRGRDGVWEACSSC